MDTHGVGELLQAACSVSKARGAASVVTREDKLQVHLARRTHALRIGADFHPVEHGTVARGHQMVYALDFDEAYTACTYFVIKLEITQRGYVHPRDARRLEYRRRTGNAHFYIVDGHADPRGIGLDAACVFLHTPYHASLPSLRKIPHPK